MTRDSITTSLVKSYWSILYGIVIRSSCSFRRASKAVPFFVEMLSGDCCGVARSIGVAIDASARMVDRPSTLSFSILSY